MAVQRRLRSKLDLLDGEEIVFEIDHHWLAGVTTLVIPVSILLIFFGLYLYGALGGGFTLAFQGPRVSLDLTGWLYLALVAFIGALWVLLGVVERDGFNERRWGLVGLGLVVAVVVAFRAAGGELYTVDASQARPFGPTALLLLLAAGVAAIVVAYLFVDLLHDRLYLTDRRVIYFNGAVLIPRLIERQVQQDIQLEDIQNVLSRTETYLQHWLNYGTITVQAANAGRPIVFRAANQAKEMQRRIFGARGDLLKRQGQRNFTELISTRVYEERAARAPYRYQYPVLRVAPFARWALSDNPTVDAAQGSLTWYPHWFFLVRALLWPFAALVLLGAGAYFAWAWRLLDPLPLALLGLLALALVVLSAAYQLEDYRNDRYMLTATTIVDIDKRPFGPESRRSAGLGTIQTVNYQTTFFSNVFGYGDVVVKTAGQGGAFTFYHVPRPREVAATINEHISAYRRGERDRTLDESLSLLRQFHMLQGQLGELRAPPRAEG